MKHHQIVAQGLFAMALAAPSAYAEDQLSRFGFQDVLLNMPFDSIPARYKGGCVESKDKKYNFCMLKDQVGSVPMTVEITVANNRVSEIRVHFPISDYDTIWLALRQKYGQENKRGAGLVEWYSNPMQPENPIPDELALHRNPKEQPRPDGTYFQSGTQYSLIHYESLAIARDTARKQQEEHNRKVKAVAEKL